MGVEFKISGDPYQEPTDTEEGYPPQTVDSRVTETLRHTALLSGTLLVLSYIHPYFCGLSLAVGAYGLYNINKISSET